MLWQLNEFICSLGFAPGSSLPCGAAEVGRGAMPIGPKHDPTPSSSIDDVSCGPLEIFDSSSIVRAEEPKHVFSRQQGPKLLIPKREAVGA
jgi:hypothetical protein